MKKILYSIIVALSAVTFTSCNKDILDTNPTDHVASDDMFSNTDKGMVALNGTIRKFWAWGWSVTGNTHQAIGPLGYSLMADLMGDDFVMAGAGSGWFWYDYLYDVKRRYSSSSWRCYDLWNYYYTIICNVNYIIAAKDTIEGTEEDINYLVGNAYALRAYCYAYAGMIFGRSYIGHEDRLCIPIYTEPTSITTTGKARSTNAQVFGLALDDINTAIRLLEGQEARHISHIGYSVACGIKSRIALYMGEYEEALDAATKAIDATSAKLTKDIFEGYNSTGANVDTIWGAEVITAQGTTNPQFMTHMDPAYKGYGHRSRKCISKYLYDKIADTDARKGWWEYIDLSVAGAAQNLSHGYQQKKFYFKDVKAPQATDQIFMRLPEMYLTKAECEARLGQEPTAIETLKAFMEYRDESYDCAKTGTELGVLTTDETGSLLEEIILQRRIELWGEFGRIYDIKRLRQGFLRTSEMGFQSQAFLTSLKTDDPESFDWVMAIPQTEIDANPLMVQNPIGSTATATEGDDPELNAQKAAIAENGE